MADLTFCRLDNDKPDMDGPYYRILCRILTSYLHQTVYAANDYTLELSTVKLS